MKKINLDASTESPMLLKDASLNVGDVLYRVFDPEDGGGYFAQPLKVLKLTANCVVFQLFDRSTLAMDRCHDTLVYTSKFDCSKECWKLNGTGDPFEQLCRRERITSEDGKAEELAYQMEIWGARDYEDLLHCLVD